MSGGDLEEYDYDSSDDNGPDSDVKPLPSLDDMDAQKDETETIEPSDYTQQFLLSYLISAPELWVKCAPIMDAKYFDPQ